MLLVVIILSAAAAFWGIRIGLYEALGQYLMMVLAVTAGIGFAGPLRESIPSDNPYLYGPCLLTIGVLAYGLQRKLAEGVLGEPDLPLPAFIDRLGGGIVGFFLALTSLSYLALVVATVRLAQLQDFMPQLKQVAQFVVGTVQVVGTLAGTGQPITLESILPK